MAHLINEGRMMYVGETPWHGLGTKLDNPATAAEAIAAARLDYKIELAPKYYINPETGNRTVIPFGKVVRRTDNGELLGEVGNLYKVIQNTEAFAFFDAIVGEGKAIYHTAGALGKGERIWILAKLPDSIHVTHEDVVDKYLILCNAHDGTMALKLFFSPERVVCNNTLVMALNTSSHMVNISHKGDIESKIKVAQQILGLTNQFYDNFATVSNAMLLKKLNAGELKKYFDDVVQYQKEVVMTSDIVKNRIETLNRLFEEGKGNNLPEVRGSVWAALNSVTEMVDHYQVTGNRLQNSWFGVGAKMKYSAYNKAVALVNN